jgi:hypothetical protein
VDQPDRFDWPYELRRESIIRPTGRLSSEWIRAEGLLMHARVSVDPTPSSSLPLVLVHGIGVASRFMVPVAELLAPYHRVSSKRSHPSFPWPPFRASGARLANE